MITPKPFDRIAVLGIGLIGGSLLRSLPRNAVGYDNDAPSRTAAREAGYQIEDSLHDAVRDADLVIIATPLPAFGAVLNEASNALPNHAILTDVASVKAPAATLVRQSGCSVPYVGGHPMAGTQHSGFTASNGELLNGAAYVLCLDEDTDLSAWLRVAALVTKLGCRVVPCTPQQHDSAIAAISGLPHVFAAALATQAASSGRLALSLAAGSFRDGTRVASTRAELSAALCDNNRHALAAQLDAALDKLIEARDHLKDGTSLLNLMTAGHRARELWSLHEDREEYEISVDVDDLQDELINLGSAGGYVLVETDNRTYGLRASRPRL